MNIVNLADATGVRFEHLARSQLGPLLAGLPSKEAAALVAEAIQSLTRSLSTDPPTDSKACALRAAEAVRTGL